LLHTKAERAEGNEAWSEARASNRENPFLPHGGGGGSRDGEEKEDLMMRNRTSGQAAFLTAQLSNKRNCQTIKRPDDDHDPLQQQAGGSMTYLLQPKPKKKKTEKDRPLGRSF